MKKIYLSLLTAALLGSSAASAQELSTVWQKYYTDYDFDSWNVATLDWNSPTEISKGAGSRVGIGMNGKVYTLNCRTMSIMELTAEGHKDVYKLPSLAGQTFTYNEMDDKFTEKTNPDYYGVFITRDDAGHFLVGHGFTKNIVPKRWTIYDPATNKGKVFDVEFSDDAKYSMLRIDVIGRAMGNVLRDGGIVIGPTAYSWSTIYDATNKKAKFPWAVAENVQRIKFINFYSGDPENDDVENVLAEGDVSEMVYLGSVQGNICQPLYGSVEEYNAAVEECGNSMDAIKNGTFLYSKDASGATFAANKYALTMGSYVGTASVANPFENMAETDMGNNYASHSAFDTFVLQGERYYVASYMASNVPTAKANISFAVFNSKGMKVASHNIDWTTNYGYCSLSYEPVDDTSVNIYVFSEAINCVIPNSAEGNYGFAGQYKFTVPAAAGIEDIVTEDADAAPVYYNLQGVEVANPENGVYIVRRGSKVSKEMIR